MGIRELAETSAPFNFIHLTDLNNDMFSCRCHLVNGISRNLFENLNLFHNYLEKAHNYCAHHIGANSQLQAAFNNNWMALKKNRDEIRKMTDESLTNMESYFDRINSKPTE